MSSSALPSASVKPFKNHETDGEAVRPQGLAPSLPSPLQTKCCSSAPVSWSAGGRVLVRRTHAALLWLLGLSASPAACWGLHMALTISASLEQQRLTQTPLLKIWVPWMGYRNFNRRRGCKCSGLSLKVTRSSVRFHPLTFHLQIDKSVCSYGKNKCAMTCPDAPGSGLSYLVQVGWQQSGNGGGGVAAMNGWQPDETSLASSWLSVQCLAWSCEAFCRRSIFHW